MYRISATGYIHFVLMSIHFQFQKCCANVMHFCVNLTLPPQLRFKNTKLDDCQHMHSQLHIPSCLFTIIIVLQATGPLRLCLMEAHEEMKSVKSLVPWVILCVGKLNQIQQISCNCCVPRKNRLQVTSDILISARIKKFIMRFSGSAESLSITLSCHCCVCVYTWKTVCVHTTTACQHLS